MHSLWTPLREAIHWRVDRKKRKCGPQIVRTVFCRRQLSARQPGSPEWLHWTSQMLYDVTYVYHMFTLTTAILMSIVCASTSCYSANTAGAHTMYIVRIHAHVHIWCSHNHYAFRNSTNHRRRPTACSHVGWLPVEWPSSTARNWDEEQLPPLYMYMWLHLHVECEERLVSWGCCVEF